MTTKRRDWLCSRDRQGRKKNPIRDTVEVFEAGALTVVANALADIGAEKLGLTQAQVGMVYSLVALAVVMHRTGKFEQNLAQQLGLGDLDDMCSLIAMFDVHSKWKSEKVLLPPAIKPFWEAAQRAAEEHAT